MFLEGATKVIGYNDDGELKEKNNEQLPFILGTHRAGTECFNPSATTCRWVS